MPSFSCLLNVQWCFSWVECFLPSLQLWFPLLLELSRRNLLPRSVCAQHSGCCARHRFVSLDVGPGPDVRSNALSCALRCTASERLFSPASRASEDFGGRPA